MNSRIKKKIHQIAKILSNDKFLNYNVSLIGGNAGICLFHFYYSKKFQNEQSTEIAYKIIEDTFVKINNGFSFHTFAGGLAGIGWLIEFLEQNDFLETDTDEILAELDEYLYKLMIEDLKNHNFDYLHGASGIALYFTKRKQSKKISEYLNDYIDILSKISIKEGLSIKWISEINSSKNEKFYNPSMSHGMASLISILSKIYSLGISKLKIKTLLAGAINYLLSIEQNINIYYSYFPNSINIKTGQKATSRLAWCYGDLGISIAIWNASQAVKNKEWETKALEILHYSTTRKDLDKNFVSDAGLCHGTAGIAHIFNRMYINTKDIKFKETANYWYTETLKMANHKKSLSGFKAWHTEKYGGWQEEFGFIEGIAGIGLTLISTISDIEPAWDEILLLS